MEIVSFSATNYRSITKAHKVVFSSITVLIGKNNEGKSNLLRALEAGMLILQNHAKIFNSSLRRSHHFKSLYV